jgi:photosystem II stability/assembly factor-like uncharacterized protein
MIPRPAVMTRGPGDLAAQAPRRLDAQAPRLGLLAALIALALLCAAALASAAAAAVAPDAPWTPVSTPNGASWAVHDIACVGSVNLILAGDGHVAVSRDAGQTWKTYVPAGHAGTAFTSVAFSSTGRGVLASGGLLLVSADWGATWGAPVYVGPGPGRAVSDVALRGDAAVAVGDGGMILASSDGGATWQQETSPVAGDLTSVAVATDGTAVAGSADGDILVRTAAWAVAGSAGAPVTSVTVATTPAWSDGLPDLYAATEHAVLGSDDGLTFAPLPDLPDLSAGSWGSVAWAGRPDWALLVAGSEDAGFFSAGGAWVSAATGLDGLVGTAAPPGQSVAYVLDAGSRVVRTLSAGREPATVQLTRSRVTAGEASRLTATVRVAAPGTLELRTRVPGRAWVTQRTVAWSTDDWGRSVRFDLTPSLTHEYVLAFKYGGTTTLLAPAAQVTVVPKVNTAKARYDLRRGAVFRFSGSVAPKLKGERVELYTDRGGSWRPVSLQRTVALVKGRTWTSRAFGTPVRETYHLRAHVARTRTHAEAWSRIVTVTIR